jgi:hypothetical protein
MRAALEVQAVGADIDVLPSEQLPIALIEVSAGVIVVLHVPSYEPGWVAG